MAVRGDEGLDPHGTKTEAAPALAYHPALDGIRAVAIGAVLLYHGGVVWAGGGYLGVEAFFVLSGFLITSLLLVELRRERTIRLGRFWARRARRLLPALFCMVAVVGIYEAFAGPSRSVPGLLGDGLATLLYVGNWHQIWTGSGYFASTARPSPFLHTWSLAIEEQFYLIWPLVVLGIYSLTGKSGRPEPGQSETGPAFRRFELSVLGVAIVGSIGSAVAMALLYNGGLGLDRVYYGTDTRAQGILAGAALACAFALVRNRQVTAGEAPPSDSGLRRFRGLLVGLLGFLGAAGVLYGMHAAGLGGGTPPGLYHGGMLAFDLAMLALIGSAVAAPRAPVGRLLAVWPMRSIGKISYGLYLWHWPLYLWLTEQSTGVSGTPLLLLRLAASFTVAIASYFLVEQPIRQRRWSVQKVRVLAPTAVIAAVVALVVASNVAPAVASGPNTNVAHLGTTTTVPLPAGSRNQVVSWAGDQPGCKVPLAVKIYPVVAEFHTCPPVRIELLGDSMADTLGFGLAEEQTAFGVLTQDNAIDGCSFATKGLGDWSGTGFEAENVPCLSELQTWRQQVRSFKAQAVIVLMGYWDCYDRLWGAADVHIGETAFDNYLFSRMKAFVQVVGAGGIPIVMLTVPYVDPAPQPDGAPQPAASAARHSDINLLLQRLAADYPQVHLVDTDRYISPGNHFDATLHGHSCRWSDGVHITPYCGAVLATHIYPLLRDLVEARGGPGPSGAPAATASPSAGGR